MICLQSDVVLGAFKVVLPMLQAVNDCEHFLITNLVVRSSKEQFTRVESDQMEAAIERLGDNATKGKIRCMSLKGDG